MKDLFETLSAQSKRHSDLIQLGINPDQAAEIAFNPENSTAFKVDNDLFEASIRTAFLSGQIFQIQVDAGKNLQSQEEAINNCIKVIKEL